MIVVPFTTTTFVAAVAAKRHRRSRGEVRPRDRHRRPARRRPAVRRHTAHRRRSNVGESVGQTPTLPTGLVTVTVTAPALPAGVVAVIVVLFTTTTFVAAVPPNVTVAPAAKFVPVIVTAVPPAVDPLFGDTLVTVGAGPDTAENVTICITHGPEPVNVAVALLLPAVVTTLSSARSPSGVVMIRDVNPLPAAAVPVATMFAPKINSFALVVVAAPLFALALLPLAPAVTSSSRHSPILQNAHIRKRRRLAERHRHRVAATRDVRRIVDRLLATLSRSSAQSPDCRCSPHCPSPTAPSTSVSFHPTTTTFRFPAVWAPG